MVSQNELDRTIRYVLIRVECVERTDYNQNHPKKYSGEELNDELEALNHVRMNLNDFINRNQDLTVDQLCILKDLKHRLFGAIQKLKEATIYVSSNCMKNSTNDHHHHPSTMMMLQKSPKKISNKSNNHRNHNNKNKHQQSSSSSLLNNGGGDTSSTKNQSSNNNPLAFGGADCSTMIRFFVNQIHKNNPDIGINTGSPSSSSSLSPAPALQHQFETTFSPNPSP